MLEEEKRSIAAPLIDAWDPKARSKLHPTINHLYTEPACLQSLKMLYRARIREYLSSQSPVSVLTLYRPILPKPFNANQPKTIRLYPLSNYTFGTKDGQPEEDPSVLARLKRLEEHYTEHGMRRTCEGVLVCHEHNHPHILMLQIANAFFKLYVGSTTNHFIIRAVVLTSLMMY